MCPHKALILCKAGSISFSQICSFQQVNPISSVTTILGLLGLWNVVNGELTKVEVARVVQMLAVLCPSVINRAYHHYLEDGLYGRRPGQGHRRITTPQQDRYLQLLACRNRQSTARSLNMDFLEGWCVYEQ